MEPEQRRERARIAQRRSRAQRRRDYEGLQARVQSLEGALESLTESCLGFSDAVISAIQKENVSTLRESIKPFMNSVLSISRNLSHDSTAGNYSDSDQTTEVPYSTTATPWSGALSEAQLVRVQLSPRLTYGLLPSVTQANHAPLDVLKYLSPQRYKGFAKALYWNTMVFGASVLSHSVSPHWEALFFYPLQTCSMTKVRDRMLRRVRFRPNDVTIVVPAADVEVEVEKHTSSSPLASEDVELEARKMHYDHELIVQSMPAVQDNINTYLEAVGVEQYLATRWGMKIEQHSSPVSESSIESGFQSRGWNIPRAERFISYLATRSRCLGDRVGYPISAVDEAVSRLFSSIYDYEDLIHVNVSMQDES